MEQMLTDETASPEQLMIEHESKEEFFKRLQQKLSPMEKKVLYLYLEGNSYTQIAELMEKTPKSIDNSLQRIRAKIISLKDEI